MGIAIAILIGLFVFLYFLLQKPKAPEVTIDETPVVDSKPDVSPVETAEIPAQQTVSANTVARNFVERFGSFSSDTNYINIDDVMSLATDALQGRLQDLADEARENTSESYYGISTKAIIFTVEVETDTTMTMRVTTQRQESIDSPANTSVRNQDIRLDMVFDGDTWLVDAFTWVD